jgi:hypothetical protein
MLDVVLYWLLLGKASGVEHSAELHDGGSVTPDFDHLMAETLIFCLPLTFGFGTEKASPPSDGGGWGFGSLTVLIAFRFIEGMGLELPGSILLWAHLAFCPFCHSFPDGWAVRRKQIGPLAAP